jgi:hypothetical protein
MAFTERCELLSELSLKVDKFMDDTRAQRFAQQRRPGQSKQEHSNELWQGFDVLCRQYNDECNLALDVAELIPGRLQEALKCQFVAHPELASVDAEAWPQGPQLGVKYAPFNLTDVEKVDHLADVRAYLRGFAGYWATLKRLLNALPEQEWTYMVTLPVRTFWQDAHDEWCTLERKLLYSTHRVNRFREGCWLPVTPPTHSTA